MPVETFGLYLVITNPATSHEACAEAAVAAHLRYVQLRMKKTSRAQIVATANTIRAITRGTGTQFIVNDDPSIAQDVEADGVHLGQDDLSLAEARRLYPSLRIFGLSTHSEAQAQNAVADHPDYCGVGPVYATPTKEIADPALGPTRAGTIIRNAPFTTVAIGGIDETNLAAVLQAGAINFAVVRSVCLASAPFDAIRRLQDIWQSFR